jgi:hypothetical protein
LRNIVRPSPVTPCSWKIRFAKSMPMIVAFSMDAFSSVAGNATSPAWHTSMPSGGASTPSLLVGGLLWLSGHGVVLPEQLHV